MPVFVIIGLIVIVCVGVAIYIARKKAQAGATKSIVDIIAFGLALIAFILSFMSFINVSRYVSDYGGSILLVYGEMGGFLPLLKLAVLFVLCLILGLKLVTRSK
jgi:hypothetical protein